VSMTPAREGRSGVFGTLGIPASRTIRAVWEIANILRGHADLKGVTA
jgi:hypothetical protein